MLTHFGIRPVEEIDHSGFDERHSDNIAPWVVFLCTEAAAQITGQTFVVAGGWVQLMQSWTPVAKIDKGDRWTVEELAEQWPDLFGDRPTGEDLGDLLPATEGIPGQVSDGMEQPHPRLGRDAGLALHVLLDEPPGVGVLPIGHGRAGQDRAAGDVLR